MEERLLSRSPSRSGHTYTLQGVRNLLIRHGWSSQQPAPVKESWPQVEGPRRRSVHKSSSKTSSPS
ncbi:winged helix-turn-helix domain-containing protein [Streptomyces bobili]|uniref:winged helix-turn-helix domain-containing protein n=1 Tax=Streptomyces bobili TaxID=67280 RepID=UPI003654AAAA